MTSINLYKIDESKNQAFLGVISEKLNRVNTIDVNRNFVGRDLTFGMSLYVPHQLDTNDVSWNWILTAFELNLW